MRENTLKIYWILIGFAWLRSQAHRNLWKMSKPCQSVLFCKYLLSSLLIISKQRFVSKKSTLSSKFDIFYAQSISNLLRSCKNVSFLKTENEKKWLSANSKQQPAWYQARIATFFNTERGVWRKRSEKSLRNVAEVAKFLDDNKPKKVT